METPDNADHIIFCAGLSHGTVTGIKNIIDYYKEDIYIHEFIDYTKTMSMPLLQLAHVRIKLVEDTVNIIKSADTIILSYENNDYDNVSLIVGIINSFKTLDITDDIIIYCDESNTSNPWPELKAYSTCNNYTYCNSYYALYLEIMDVISYQRS